MVIFNQKILNLPVLSQHPSNYNLAYMKNNTDQNFARVRQSTEILETAGKYLKKKLDMDNRAYVKRIHWLKLIKEVVITLSLAAKMVKSIFF